MSNVALGYLALLVGAINLVWPYEVAKFEERMDSIGSSRSWSEVEPAEWKVLLTRLLGAGGVLLGIGILLTG